MKRFYHFLILLWAVNFSLGGKSISQEVAEWQEANYYLTQILNASYFSPGISYGDFDNDHFVDILIGHRQDDGKISLLMNNGEGKFESISTINTIPYPTNTVIKDLNNDNNLDMVFAHSSAYNADNRISIHLGNGDGTFQDNSIYNVEGSYTKFVDAGDLNNDGYQDIVASSAGWPDCFSVLLNDGDCTFTLKNHYNGGEEPNDIKLADFNGDNNLDVVMGCVWGYGEINIYHGNGDGTFSDAVVYLQDHGNTYKSGPKPIDIVNLDNENGSDIIVGYSSDPFTRVYFYKMMNHGDGSFTDSLVAADYYPIKAYDWNHDGNVDILANRYNYSTTTGSTFLGVALLQNDGTGRFTDVGFVKLKASGNFTDLNNDGLLDFAFIKGTTDSIGVYLQAKGSTAPKILYVKDVPDDQGGKVTIKWKASSLDTNVNDLPFYSIWRAIPEKEPMQMLSMSQITPEFKGIAYRSKMLNGQPYAWEWLANQPAHRLSWYTYTAATLNDSMSTTDGKHYFMVSAHTSDPNVFYDSNVDSGYSVDNLVPLAPGNLAARYESGQVFLHWHGTGDTDLQHYLLYRSTDPGIDPNVLPPFATSRDTVFVDNSPLVNDQLYYLVRAQDIHDNLGQPSNEVALTVTGVRLTTQKIPTAYQLSQNYPNPFNPATTIAYALSRPAYVTLTVYNLLGEEIEKLVNTTQPAGTYEVQWQPMNLPNGVYVYQFKAGDFVMTRKALLLK